MRNDKVVALIVSFHPDLDALQQLVEALLPQVSAIVVVDNGSAAERFPGRREAIAGHAHILPLGANLGIARAHNEGIEWARGQGAGYVLLLDQDSLPAPDMVAKLVEAAATRPDAAGLGPRFIDERREDQPPFIRVEGLSLRRIGCTGTGEVIPVAYVISSGCLVPIGALDTAGPMREDLFIDYVDVEWGLRAGRRGLQSYGVCDAVMHHALGDAPDQRFGRSIPMHSPLRHYYLFRNAALLYRSPEPPLNWKLVDGWRLLLKYGYYTLFATPRLAHLRMMTLGLWHGLINRSGKL